MGGYKLRTKNDLLKTGTNSITTLESLEHTIFPTVAVSKGYFIAREFDFSFPNNSLLAIWQHSFCFLLLLDIAGR